MNGLTRKRRKGRKRKNKERENKERQNNPEEWEDREIEQEGTHPYHEKYTKEGIVKE